MGSPDHTLLIPTTWGKQIQRKPKKGRMAAAAIANYKRRTTQLQQEKSQDQPNNFSHQSTQGSIFSRPSPDFTVSANPNGSHLPRRGKKEATMKKCKKLKVSQCLDA